MAWLEMTLNTPQGSVNALVTELTALGFEDLVHRRSAGI